MMEYIFRNITDIRVFDIFYVEYSNYELVDIDDVMESLEYPHVMRTQVEDSIDHLVKEKILEQVYIKKEVWGGCRTCLYTDKLHLPRVGKHKSHVPFKVIHDDFPQYRLLDNKITQHLFAFLWSHSIEIVNDVLKETEKK